MAERDSAPSGREQTDARQALNLKDEATQILEECRMVLPGIQALFGFQLVAVFSNAFGRLLSPREQTIHFASLTLVAAAVALVTAPAAVHRQGEPHEVTHWFVSLASRLLTFGMMPLMAAITLDVYLIGRVILHGAVPAIVAAGLVLAWFLALWLVLPRMHRRHVLSKR